VLNNTKVFPARLIGKRVSSGGRVELFLINEVGAREWEALVRPARRLHKGDRIEFGDGRLIATMETKHEEGRCRVSFECEDDFETLIDEIGLTPLPPYIKAQDDVVVRDHSQTYQTIYASERGAIAAPTAGLHFTPRVLDEIVSRGAEIVELTLHVGYGTFAPVRVRDVSQHSVEPERCIVSHGAADAINRALDERRRIIAIGTTTARALESGIDEHGAITAGPRLANLTITPGYRFRVVDALLTNFHLPRSSLLVLVSTFAGRDLILGAYRHAVERRYRFYSYGDCMLITSRRPERAGS
jgi:S-adenosylmethionine:tRNA ribosyltransferase-isomerase